MKIFLAISNLFDGRRWLAFVLSYAMAVVTVVLLLTGHVLAIFIGTALLFLVFFISNLAAFKYHDGATTAEEAATIGSIASLLGCIVFYATRYRDWGFGASLGLSIFTIIVILILQAVYVFSQHE